MKKRLECEVFGRVQMVMFRDFTTRKARACDLVGSVKNNKSGTVSIIAEGEESALKKFSEHVHRGSLFARVDRVEEKWLDPLGGYKNFDILY